MPPILCLGEAIVDLVSEREAASFAEAGCFRPHFGGALANVAVGARRAGAPAALAGGVGDDDWGHWLCQRLQDEGVGVDWLAVVAGLETPLAFVAFDHEREPRFLIYGDGIASGVLAVGDRIEAAVGASAALVFGSNTLVSEPEREVTLRARRLALEAQVPVLFDPNLRQHRWDDLALARRLCREACAGSLVVRANLAEARWLGGLDAMAPPGDAAGSLVALGARVAVVTLGARGAICRGACSAEQAGVAVELVSPLGAGDAFMGALAAGLADHGWDPAATAQALPAAVAAGARACTAWEAVP